MSLAEITRPIEGDLDKVRALVIEMLEQHSCHWVIKEARELALSKGSKLLRPILALHTGKALGASVDSLVQAAATVELMHMATLIHDDVIDQSETRRGKPSLNARMGNHLAVLGGDYLLACSLRTAAKLGSDAVFELGEAVIQVVTGELDQLTSLNRICSPAQYLQRVQSKTGALFSASMKLAAIAAQAPHTIRAVAGQFGQHLGILFQMRDDYLDIFGEEERLGKPVGTDILGGIVTLPIILASRRKPDPQLEALINRGEFQQEHQPQLREWINKSGALDEFASIARQHQAKALAALSLFPQGPCVDALALCVTQAVERRS